MPLKAHVTLNSDIVETEMKAISLVLITGLVTMMQVSAHSNDSAGDASEHLAIGDKSNLGIFGTGGAPLGDASGTQNGHAVAVVGNLSSVFCNRFPGLHFCDWNQQ